MKQSIYILVTTFIFSSCSWLHSQYVSGLEGEELPNFSITLQDSARSFSTASIAKGRPFAIFLYRPDCSFCRGQLQDILNHITSLHQMNIYLISNYSYGAIKTYSDNLHLKQYPFLIIARDSSADILNYFKTPAFPYLAFYNDQKQLKQVLVGQQPFTSIQKILSDLNIGQLHSAP